MRKVGSVLSHPTLSRLKWMILLSVNVNVQRMVCDQRYMSDMIIVLTQSSHREKWQSSGK